MTTTTANQVSLPNTNSAVVELEGAGLDGIHLDETRLSETFRPQAPLTSLLCDAKLLEEISLIPDRMAFKIGDVAEILGIKQYVLRYWETEFEILSPKKAVNNQRMYHRRDVENALLIRKLLHRDRFSIEGARNAMKELKSQVRKEKDRTQIQNKFESLNEAVGQLVLDIRQVRNLFL